MAGRRVSRIADPATVFSNIQTPYYTPVETRLNQPIPVTHYAMEGVPETVMAASKMLMESPLNPQVRAQMQTAVAANQAAQQYYATDAANRQINQQNAFQTAFQAAKQQGMSDADAGNAANLAARAAWSPGDLGMGYGGSQTGAVQTPGGQINPFYRQSGFTSPGANLSKNAGTSPPPAPNNQPPPANTNSNTNNPNAVKVPYDQNTILNGYLNWQTRNNFKQDIVGVTPNSDGSYEVIHKDPKTGKTWNQHQTGSDVLSTLGEGPTNTAPPQTGKTSSSTSYSSGDATNRVVSTDGSAPSPTQFAPGTTVGQVADNTAVAANQNTPQTVNLGQLPTDGIQTAQVNAPQQNNIPNVTHPVLAAGEAVKIAKGWDTGIKRAVYSPNGGTNGQPAYTFFDGQGNQSKVDLATLVAHAPGAVAGANLAQTMHVAANPPQADNVVSPPQPGQGPTKLNVGNAPTFQLGGGGQNNQPQPTMPPGATTGLVGGTATGTPPQPPTTQPGTIDLGKLPADVNPPAQTPGQGDRIVGPPNQPNVQDMTPGGNAPTIQKAVDTGAPPAPTQVSDVTQQQQNAFNAYRKAHNLPPMNLGDYADKHWQLNQQNKANGNPNPAVVTERSSDNYTYKSFTDNNGNNVQWRYAPGVQFKHQILTPNGWQDADQTLQEQQGEYIYKRLGAGYDQASQDRMLAQNPGRLNEIYNNLLRVDTQKPMDMSVGGEYSRAEVLRRAIMDGQKYAALSKGMDPKDYSGIASVGNWMQSTGMFGVPGDQSTVTQYLKQFNDWLNSNWKGNPADKPQVNEANFAKWWNLNNVRTQLQSDYKQMVPYGFDYNTLNENAGIYHVNIPIPGVGNAPGTTYDIYNAPGKMASATQRLAEDYQLRIQQQLDRRIDVASQFIKDADQIKNEGRIRDNSYATEDKGTLIQSPDAAEVNRNSDPHTPGDPNHPNNQPTNPPANPPTTPPSTNTGGGGTNPPVNPTVSNRPTVLPARTVTGQQPQQPGTAPWSQANYSTYGRPGTNDMGPSGRPLFGGGRQTTTAAPPPAPPAATTSTVARTPARTAAVQHPQVTQKKTAAPPSYESYSKSLGGTHPAGSAADTGDSYGVTSGGYTNAPENPPAAPPPAPTTESPPPNEQPYVAPPAYGVPRTPATTGTETKTAETPPARTETPAAKPPLKSAATGREGTTQDYVDRMITGAPSNEPTDVRIQSSEGQDLTPPLRIPATSPTIVQNKNDIGQLKNDTWNTFFDPNMSWEDKQKAIWAQIDNAFSRMSQRERTNPPYPVNAERAPQQYLPNQGFEATEPRTVEPYRPTRPTLNEREAIGNRYGSEEYGPTTPTDQGPNVSGPIYGQKGEPREPVPSQFEQAPGNPQLRQFFKEMNNPQSPVGKQPNTASNVDNFSTPEIQQIIRNAPEGTYLALRGELRVKHNGQMVPV